jgi:hypothetical protein
VPDRPARWLPSARELDAIARNLGVKAGPEPEGILAHLAGAVADTEEPTTVYAAGLLYKLVLMTRPYGGDSWAYALEAARVVLLANGHPAARISQERSERLRADVESGALTAAVEIGRRLLDL